MVSKFLLNIFSKGSIHLQEGRLYLWNNPFLFIPLTSFALLQHSIIEQFGEDGAKLIYRLGKIQGKNSTQVFIKRFGYKPTKDNFGYFVDGSTLVGMGTMNLVEYDLDAKTAVISCSDSTFAKAHRDMFNNVDSPVDHYMRGILAGGTEPVVDHLQGCYETTCIGKGDDKCEYHIEPVDQEEPLETFKELSDRTRELIEETSSLFLKRKSFLKNLFSKQLLSFRDGALHLGNTIGIIIPTYLLSILSHLIVSNNRDKSVEIFKAVAKDYIVNLETRSNMPTNPSTAQLNDFLSVLDRFGFGQFKTKGYVNKKLIIENTSNPYPVDYKSVFGKQEIPVDFLNIALLKEMFRKIGKETEIKETSCIGCGAKSCIYSIEFK